MPLIPEDLEKMRAYDAKNRQTKRDQEEIDKENRRKTLKQLGEAFWLEAEMFVRDKGKC